MNQLIVCATDFSPQSEESVRYAGGQREIVTVALSWPVLSL
jgi:hypothetical protein